MKKIISIILSLGLAVTLVTTVSAAPNLSGSWSGFGYSFKASQTGNNITLIATNGDISGKVSLEGTITGNTVEGRQILVAKGCPNLEKYVPTKGTISSDGNSITVTHRNSDYDPDKCVDMPGNESEETGSYTKVSSASTPSEAKSISPKKVSTQDKEPLGCEGLVKLLGSEECKFWAMEEYEIWCAETGEELITTNANGMNRLYLNRDPDYLVDRSLETREQFNKCWGETPEEQEKNLKEGPKQQMKQSKSGKDGNPLNIFGFNPLETWRNIQGLLSIPEGLNSLVQTAEILSVPAEIKIQVPEPVISLDPEGKRWDFLPGFIPHESIKPGLTITATKPTTFQTGSAVIQLRPNNNQEGSMEIGTDPFLQGGEAEIIVEPQNGQQFELQTPNAEIFVIGTKFLVAYDPKKNQTLVAVYEGKVEVKSRDGKTAIVSPSGDPSTGSGQGKPGVVVVSQKLSPIKLAITGSVFLGIIGVMVYILKRKFFAKGSIKKRR